MTDQIAPAIQAADAVHAEPAHVDAASTDGATSAPAATPDAHGMRPVAMAFVLGNAAVLAVFAVVAATGHLDIGLGAGGFGDVLLSSATAAPTN